MKFDFNMRYFDNEFFCRLRPPLHQGNKIFILNNFAFISDKTQQYKKHVEFPDCNEEKAS